MGWIFAHRYPHLIRKLVVVNCPHPKTLVRAVLHFEDFQTIRIPWVPFFEIPWLPEFFLSTELGRRGLKLSFTLREGRKGTMNVALVDELVTRFQKRALVLIDPPYEAQDEWARLVSGLGGALKRFPSGVYAVWYPLTERARLDAVYATPITVPVTLVWGAKDGALSARVAMNSGIDAGCYVECRPLPGVGHFVSLEAADELAVEIKRLLG